MIFSYFPIFLSNELGLNNTLIGVIEGVAISSAFLSKTTFGIMSDYVKNRKSFIMWGNALSTLSKVFFAVAFNFGTVFFARVFGRLSKGLRSAPTDALIADITEKRSQGVCFGVRQMLYTLGAVSGGLLGMGIFYLTQSYRIVFLAASIPALASCFVLAFGIKHGSEKLKLHPRWCAADIKKMPKSFWFLLSCVFLLMMARFSETFLVLRSQELGFRTDFIPIVIIVYELMHALTAWPFGWLADKYNRFTLLALGVSMLVLANIIMLTIPTISGFFCAIVMCGVHMGMTQGLLSTLVASHTVDSLRGTAYAIYYSTIGAAVFFGNIIAGSAADFAGSIHGSFVMGLVFSSLTLCVIIMYVIYSKFVKKS